MVTATRKLLATDDPIVNRARALAYTHHRDQRWGDKPYMAHLAAVAHTLASKYPDRPELIAAGFLHDSLEDTDCTEDEIADYCGPVTLAIVQGMTHPDDEDYALCIDRVTQEPDVARVKLADMEHNSGGDLSHPKYGRHLAHLRTIVAIYDGIDVYGLTKETP